MHNKNKKFKFNIMRIIAIICTIALFSNSVFALSLNGVESAKADGNFTVLEIVPQAGSGSIGYYVSGAEPPSADVDTQAELEARTSQLSSASLLSSDLSTPLGEVAQTLPWQAVGTGMFSITVPEQSTVVTGQFTPATAAGTGSFNLRAGSADEYEYIGQTGADYVFAQSATGTSHTVYYTTVLVQSGKGFTNNSWFNRYVLDEAVSVTNVSVTSVTPSDITDIAALTTLLNNVDLLVISAGYNYASNTSLQNSYASNDLNAAQVNAILAAATSAQQPLAVAFDSRLQGVQVAATSTDTAIAGLAKALVGSSDATNGFVRGNVYCFTPDASRAQFATNNFNTAYGEALYNTQGTAYFEVYNEIVTENSFRSEALNGAAAPADYYLPLNVSMATALRHIINYTNQSGAKPQISFVNGAGSSLSYLFFPAIYNSGNLTATVLDSGAGDELSLKLSDANTARSDIALALYSESPSGAYYLDTSDPDEKKMLAYVAGVAPADAVRFDKTLLSAAIHSDIKTKYIDTKTAIVDAVYAFDVPSSAISLLGSSAANDIDIYLEATTTIGFRAQSALSEKLEMRKLGLLLLG